MMPFWQANDVSATAKLVGIGVGDRTPCVTCTSFLIDERELMDFACVNRSDLIAALKELEDRNYLAFAFGGGRQGQTVIGGNLFCVRAETPFVHEPSPPMQDWRIKREKVLLRTEARCFYCGVSDEERRLELDHMHPHSRGGRDGKGLTNLVGACRSCNREKRDRTVEEYRSLRAERLGIDAGEVVFFGERPK